MLACLQIKGVSGLGLKAPYQLCFYSTAPRIQKSPGKDLRRPDLQQTLASYPISYTPKMGVSYKKDCIIGSHYQDQDYRRVYIGLHIGNFESLQASL